MIRPDELRAQKLKKKCRKCGIHGHCESDNFKNGQIKNNVPNVHENEQTNINRHQNQPQLQKDRFSQHNGQ